MNFAYNDSAVPSGIKEWCSGKMLSIIPKDLVQKLFTIVLAYKNTLSDLEVVDIPNGVCITHKTASSSPIVQKPTQNPPLKLPVIVPEKPLSALSKSSEKKEVIQIDESSNSDTENKSSPEFIPNFLQSLFKNQDKTEKSENEESTLTEFKDLLEKITNKPIESEAQEIIKEEEPQKQSTTQTNDKREWQCKFCPKNYTRSQHLARHMRETHPDLWSLIKQKQGSFICELCPDAKFSGKIAYKKFS